MQFISNQPALIQRLRNSMPLVRIVSFLAATILAGSTANWAWGQEDKNRYNLLLSPSSREAMKALQKNCRLWTQHSLRSAIQDVSRQYGVPIWLDRQIDPTQVVRLGQTDGDSTVLEELMRLASETGNRGGLVENIFLIAPSDRFARIQRAAIVLHGQIVSASAELGGIQQPLAWPDITSINEAIDLIQQTWRVSIDYELPHDLYYAVEFPPCSLATQLSLLLGGFDLQAAVVGDSQRSEVTSSASENSATGRLQLAVSPLSEDYMWRDSYADSLLGGRLTAQKRQQLQQRYPTSTIRDLSDRRLVVLAETNAHVELLSMPFAKTRDRSTVRSGRAQIKKYSFSVEELLPVEAVLSNLAQSFELQIEWAAETTQAHRNRLIQLRIENATQQELLEEVCRQASLQMVVQGDKYIVGPSERN